MKLAERLKPNEVKEKLKPYEVKTNNETRIYLIDLSEVKENYEPLAKTDEEFIQKAEKLGTVYSLFGFQEAFNCDEFSQDQCFIRII